VNAVVTLQMTAAEFELTHVKEKFKEAVALAAKTTVDKVTIVKVVQKSGGSRRRMLSVGGESHVLMEIKDGEGVGLDLDLDGYLEKAGLSSGGYRSWIEPHEVTATRVSFF
jgi:hypothetical protein